MNSATASFQTRNSARLHSGAAWNEEGTNFSIFSHDASLRQCRHTIKTAAPLPDQINEQIRQRTVNDNIQRIHARSVVDFEAHEIYTQFEV